MLQSGMPRSDEIGRNREVYLGLGSAAGAKASAPAEVHSRQRRRECFQGGGSDHHRCRGLWHRAVHGCARTTRYGPLHIISPGMPAPISSPDAHEARRSAAAGLMSGQIFCARKVFITKPGARNAALFLIFILSRKRYGLGAECFAGLFARSASTPTLTVGPVHRQEADERPKRP
jgi:hypothetical protein